jgi:Flp pilus assembly protein TadD
MAAALLHSDALLLSRRDESYHLKAVRNYIEGMDDVSSRRAFEKKWFLAVSHRLRDLHRYKSAWQLLEAAREKFPEDLEIRMEIAAVWEMEGCHDEAELLDRAENEYRTILQIKPDHVEAHLRLARVLQLQGRLEEATREIKSILDHAYDARTELIAYILLGNIHNQRGEVAQEVESFRAAVEIDPHNQVAAVALSHALHRAGDLAGSQRVIERLLTPTDPKLSNPDEWWRFQLASSEHLDSLLEDMREELSP